MAAAWKTRVGGEAKNVNLCVRSKKCQRSWEVRRGRASVWAASAQKLMSTLNKIGYKRLGEERTGCEHIGLRLGTDYMADPAWGLTERHSKQSAKEGSTNDFQRATNKELGSTW